MKCQKLAGVVPHSCLQHQEVPSGLELIKNFLLTQAAFINSQLYKSVVRGLSRLHFPATGRVPQLLPSRFKKHGTWALSPGKLNLLRWDAGRQDLEKLSVRGGPKPMAKIQLGRNHRPIWEIWREKLQFKIVLMGRKALSFMELIFYRHCIRFVVI